jgi:hypothetical protein
MCGWVSSSEVNNVFCCTFFHPILSTEGRQNKITTLFSIFELSLSCQNKNFKIFAEKMHGEMSMKKPLCFVNIYRQLKFLLNEIMFILKII